MEGDAVAASGKSKTGGAAKSRKAGRKGKGLLRRIFGILLWPVGWLWRRLWRLGLGFACLAVIWVLLYRVIDPPGGYYMLAERWRLGGLSHEWRDLSAMSESLPLAAIAAEDARFCAHSGFDLAAIEAAIEANAAGRRLRGGSTISQQVAKNLFLWPERSWLRKGLEAGFTLLIETLWPKQRIVEIYLNIAEFDEGVFGAGAAARHYFGRDAAGLDQRRASLLAAILPDPKGRSAARPGPWTRNRAASIAAGARTLKAEGRADCALPAR
ncbi:MAG: monofunctional biosynthetic peptidoglycan transglycosylase [Pseudomonadota bacterium]